MAYNLDSQELESKVLETTDALILCTRNRAQQLQSRLAEYRCFEVLPSVILIVDSSDNDDTRMVVTRASQDSTSPVSYLRTSPGLPHQRNVGVSWVRNNYPDLELIHFLDDDIIPMSDYFSHVRQICRDFPNVIAVGGFDSELNPEQNRGLMKRICGIGSKNYGVILSSGIAIPAHPRHNIEDSEWLVGGMQSVRTWAFDHVQFDASLRMYGEDVDFYMRIRDLGDVVCSRNLPVKHLNDPSNRDSWREIHLYHNGIRWLLARRYPDRISLIRVLQVALVLALGELVLYMRTHDIRHRAASRGNVEFLYRIAIGQPVVQFVDGGK